MDETKERQAFLERWPGHKASQELWDMVNEIQEILNHQTSTDRDRTLANAACDALLLRDHLFGDTAEKDLWDFLDVIHEVNESKPNRYGNHPHRVGILFALADAGASMGNRLARLEKKHEETIGALSEQINALRIEIAQLKRKA